MKLACYDRRLVGVTRASSRVVCVAPLRLVTDITRTPHYAAFARYPGPLEHCKRGAVVTHADAATAAATADAQEERGVDAHERVLLWRVVRLLLDRSGALFAGDASLEPVVQMLLDGVDNGAHAATLAANAVPTSDAATAVC
jgi:hypothetical protein